MIKAESTTVINRPVADVFAFVSDTTNEPRWHTDVVQAEPMTSEAVGVGSRFKWVMDFMGHRDAVMRVVRYEPDRVQELAAENAVMGLKPTITYLVEPAPEGTRFTRQIAMSFAVGSRLADPMMGGQVRKSNAQFVQNLKDLLEQGADHPG